MAPSTDTVVNIAISLLVASLFLPLALDNLFSVNTTAWSTTAQTVWEFLPIGGLLGLLILFMEFRRSRRN